MSEFSVNHALELYEDKEREELLNLITQYDIYTQILLEKLRISNPATYDLPELLFDREEEESEEEYKKRQDDALKYVIEKKLYIIKDDEIKSILIFREMLNPIADLFFGRANKVIWWGPRGGGKSLSAAIFIFLSLIYHKKSIINIAGSSEQSKAVYAYTKTFWDIFPGMSENLIDKKPFQHKTSLKTGIELLCLDSPDAAVGKHHSILVCDESCTGSSVVDNKIMRAVQGTMSEKEPKVLFLSTFHHPFGLFADIWDDAESKGFTRYKWNIFHSMRKCEVGLEVATEEDPEALEYCREICPLTWKEDVTDAGGEVIRQDFCGCNGVARNSEGWMKRDEVIKIQDTNKGTEIFKVEYACERPSVGSKLYSKELIGNCKKRNMDLIGDEPLYVGIDWGMTQTGVVMGSEIAVDFYDKDRDIWTKKRGVGVLESAFLSGVTENPVIMNIERIAEFYGKREVIVFADRSHNYCNTNLESYGWDVYPVDFSKWKETGIRNLIKWFLSGRLQVADTDNNNYLLTQMENMRRGMDDKVLKSNKNSKQGDHGPDALLCLLLAFLFDDYETGDLSGDLIIL